MRLQEHKYNLIIFPEVTTNDQQSSMYPAIKILLNSVLFAYSGCPYNN